MLRDPVTDKPLFEQNQVAIDTKKMEMQTSYNTWQVPVALNSNDVLSDMIEFMSADDTSDEMKEWLNEFDFLMKINDYEDEGEQGYESGEEEQIKPPKYTELVKPYYFSGDNLTFCVILFNTEYDFVRKMLDLDEDETGKGWYVMTLVVRYPVLNINIDQTMINIRHKYFMRYSPNKLKWNEWRDGKWHIPGDRAWRDPQEFQNKPDPDDPLDRVVERDSRGNVVYPLRLLFHLPPNMTYRALKSKRGNLSLDFYVNNIDPDPLVRHKLPNGSEEVWDHIQLFRINAETMVSREGYREHGRSFFKFRLDEIPPGAPVYPFKEYLDEYQDLQETWADIWNRKWPNMEGWVRLEPEENPRARLPIQPELPVTPAATRAPLSRPITARNTARALSERRQNEKFLLHMKYDSMAGL